jgi:hypothetical protein
MKTLSSIIFAVAIFGMLLPACGSGEDKPIEGCSNLMANCIDEPHFNDLKARGLVDVPSCEAFFRCALDFYSGDCLSDLDEILDCLSIMEGTGCVACDEMFMELMHACPAPEACGN